ncbi:MAG: hypothetical protein D6753_12240 [Planctomycetota bacterium]|nr:MAG: hypothetical protein D6753_12240 [Planctomycetota bacterium]
MTMQPNEPQYEPIDLPEEMLSAYLDGELAPQERLQVEQRLARDPDWQRKLEELQSARELVQQLPAWPASATSFTGDDLVRKAGDEASLTEDSDHHQPHASQADGHSGGIETEDASLVSSRATETERGSKEPEEAARLHHRTGRGWIRMRQVRILGIAASMLLAVGIAVRLWWPSSATMLATSDRARSTQSETGNTADAMSTQQPAGVGRFLSEDLTSEGTMGASPPASDDELAAAVAEANGGAMDFAIGKEASLTENAKPSSGYADLAPADGLAFGATSERAELPTEASELHASPGADHLPSRPPAPQQLARPGMLAEDKRREGDSMGRAIVGAAGAGQRARPLPEQRSTATTNGASDAGHDAITPVAIVYSEPWTPADIAQSSPAITQLFGKRLTGLPPAAQAAPGPAGGRSLMAPPMLLVTVPADRYSDASRAAIATINRAERLDAFLQGLRSVAQDQAETIGQPEPAPQTSQESAQVLFMFVESKADAERILQRIRSQIDPPSNSAQTAVDSVWILPGTAVDQVGDGRTIVVIQRG